MVFLLVMMVGVLGGIGLGLRCVILVEVEESDEGVGKEEKDIVII